MLSKSQSSHVCFVAPIERHSWLINSMEQGRWGHQHDEFVLQTLATLNAPVECDWRG
jgi:hypothetical protein